MLDNPAFQALPATTQHLLEFISVVYTPTSATQLAKLWSLTGYTEPSDAKRLRPLLDELVQSGWLSLNKQGGYACTATYRDALTRHALQAERFAAYAKIVDTHLSPEMPQQRWYAQQVWSDVGAALRDLRLAVLLGDARGCAQRLTLAMQQYASSPHFRPHPWFILWGEPLDSAWLPYLPDSTLLQVLAPVYLAVSDDPKQDISPLWQECSQRLQTTQLDTTLLWDVFADSYYTQLWLRGQWQHPLAVQPSEQELIRSEYWHVFASAHALALGKPTEAIAHYQTGLKAMRKRQGSRKTVFENDLEALYVLALLIAGDAKSLKEAKQYIDSQSYRIRAYALLGYYAEALLSGKNPVLPDDVEYYSNTPLTLLVALLVRYWLGAEDNAQWLKQAATLYRQTDSAGYHWLAAEFAATLATLLPEQDQRKALYTQLAQTAHTQAGTQPLIQLYQPQPAWQRTLEALQRFGSAAAPRSANPKAGAERMIWMLSKMTDSGRVRYQLSPRVQKAAKTGWTGGRNVALKKLATEPEAFPFLSPEDQRVCQAIEREHTYYHPSYHFDMDSVWQYLIGHPRVYWETALNSPLDIQQGREELQILKQKGGKLRIKLFPELPNSQTFTPEQCFVVEETTLQLRVYKLSAAMLHLHSILGKQGLVVPAEAEASVRQTLTALAPLITIQSDIAGMDNAETVEADSRLHLHLLPWHEGLRLLMRVQPLGAGGPSFPVGTGRNNAMAEIDGRLLKASRNLKQERQQATALLQDCPALAAWEDTNDDLILEEPEQCLEALQQLHGLGERVVLAWPEGEKLRITQQVSGQNLRLKLKQSGDWFEIDGKLHVNDQLVLSLRQLLELSQTAKGRFLQLGEGQFLTLTRQFQKRLETLRAYAENAGKNAIKVGTLAGMALEDFFDEAAELEADKHWKAHVNKLKQVRDSHPAVPANLQAELRDYQEEGLRWMLRLAAWGVGGCLADDMGLGKTVQTLGVLLARAEQGAALVVAPVSVCNNWYSECQRFAPDLRPILYRGKDRQQLVENLQARDLLIASYGLLQQDIETLQQRQWATIVLDEAQAIKNSNTKRTQAVYQLQGDFRLVTTGTPIENHLGELWSLFRFLNPGLLFAQQKFSERFQTPIERDNDEAAHHALKKLVQPFILRRTKNQVLQELPPRTEITLTVSLSDAEMALYEALRQQALERFAQPSADVEKQHIAVLAEITKLRLAACHPQLAMPTSGLASSKLQAFGELILELRENQHKALVFSQFVKHLELIRAWLDTQKIPYQYLDGSTLPEQRQQRVAAFQRGEGDVFLISLKAGGFGLNLTAADYVIHMDPWWNPAVEDQASDRAHRIGQQRPVTVYRVVAENTIEEKIVKLHAQKRDLAESLLEGSDSGGKLSAQEMLEMIRGNA